MKGSDNAPCSIAYALIKVGGFMTAYQISTTDYDRMPGRSLAWMLYSMAAACVAITLALSMPVPAGKAKAAEAIINAAPFAT
jgi:hypothetical protein